MSLKKYSLPKTTQLLKYPEDLGVGMLENFLVFTFYNNRGTKDSKDNISKTEYINDKTIHLPFSMALTNKQTMEWSSSDLGNSSDVINGEYAAALEKTGINIAEKFKGILAGLLGGNGKDAVEFDKKSFINPRTNMLFKGISFRNFNFEFNMKAKSANESKAIKEIIRIFKQYSAPKISSEYFTYPAYVSISAVSGGKELFKFKPAVLTEVGVAYNESGIWSTFDDGSPVSQRLSLVVSEVEQIGFDDEGLY